MSQEKKTAEVIPLTAEIELRVSGAIYARLSQVLQYLYRFENEEEYNSFVSAVKDKKTDGNEKAYHFETIALIVDHLEKCAREQKQTETVEINEENNQQDPQSQS
jgi:hypothetical protein